MNNKGQKNTLWLNKEWKEKVKELITNKSKCNYCDSKEKLTIHHLNKNSYENLKEYLSIILPEENEDYFNALILCNRCHLATHRGMRLCSYCKKKYYFRKYLSCFNCKEKALEVNVDFMKEIDEEEKFLNELEIKNVP